MSETRRYSACDGSGIQPERRVGESGARSRGSGRSGGVSGSGCGSAGETGRRSRCWEPQFEEEVRPNGPLDRVEDELRLIHKILCH